MAGGDRARGVVGRRTRVLKSRLGNPSAAPALAEPVVLAAAAPPRERKESRTAARWSWVGTGLLGGGALTLGCWPVNPARCWPPSAPVTPPSPAPSTTWPDARRRQ